MLSPTLPRKLFSDSNFSISFATSCPIDLFVSGSILARSLLALAPSSSYPLNPLTNVFSAFCPTVVSQPKLKFPRLFPRTTPMPLPVSPYSSPRSTTAFSPKSTMTGYVVLAYRFASVMRLYFLYSSNSWGDCASASRLISRRPSVMDIPNGRAPSNIDCSASERGALAPLPNPTPPKPGNYIRPARPLFEKRLLPRGVGIPHRVLPLDPVCECAAALRRRRD